MKQITKRIERDSLVVIVISLVVVFLGSGLVFGINAISDASEEAAPFPGQTTEAAVLDKSPSSIAEHENWDKAANYCSEVIANKLFTEESIDTYAEFEQYKKDGQFNGDTVMNILSKQVTEIENKREAERKAAEEAARKKAEAEAAAARAAAAKQQVSRSSSGSSSSKSTPSNRSYSSPSNTSGGVWSKSQVSGTLAAACDYYGISGSDKSFIVNKGTSIAYRESRYNTQAKNGQYLGLFQFGSAWGSASNRLDGTWSCYRFIRVYKEGGLSKIKQHWASTY